MKEFCIHGHKMTPENTYTYKGSSNCRQCHNEEVKKYYEANPLVHNQGRTKQTRVKGVGEFRYKYAPIGLRRECPQGHLMIPRNIYITQKLHSLKNGGYAINLRKCRTCSALAARKWQKRNPEKQKMVQSNRYINRKWEKQLKELDNET